MEDYDIFEDENSEWMKGLQLVKDFPHSENADQEYLQSLQRNNELILEPTEETLHRSAAIEVKQQGHETLAEWDHHARNSPFQTLEMTNSVHPPPLRRSYSFDGGIPAPVMVESYLPTTHGVIRITFPSQRTFDTQDEQISEIVQSHLSNYYHFARSSKRSHSLPSFPTGTTTTTSVDPELENYITTTQKVFRSSHEKQPFLSRSSSTTNLSSQSTTPELSHDLKIDANSNDYYSLFCSDSSDDGSHYHEKNPSPENAEGTPTTTKRKTRSVRRKHLNEAIDENDESLLKEGDEDEEFEDDQSDEEEEDENFDEDEEDDSDHYSNRKKRRRVRKSASSADSSLQPRRKASAFARNVLMDWLVEHETNPYPTKRQKQELATKSGLSMKQIVHWMSNIRKRRLIPLLSGRRIPTSNVDIKFIEEYEKKKSLKAQK